MNIVDDLGFGSWMDLQPPQRRISTGIRIPAGSGPIEDMDADQAPFALIEIRPKAEMATRPEVQAIAGLLRAETAARRSGRLRAFILTGLNDADRWLTGSDTE